MVSSLPRPGRFPSHRPVPIKGWVGLEACTDLEKLPQYLPLFFEYLPQIIKRTNLITYDIWTLLHRNLRTLVYTNFWCLQPLMYRNFEYVQIYELWCIWTYVIWCKWTFYMHTYENWGIWTFGEYKLTNLWSIWTYKLWCI